MRRSRPLATALYTAATIVAFALLSVASVACDRDDEPLVAAPGEIAGEYLRVESYVDPGDGSGTYAPVASERRITVAPDSTFASNQDLCQFGEGGDASTGRFDAEGRVTMDDCAFGPAEMSFRDGVLEVAYFCFEGCGDRYRRVR